MSPTPIDLDSLVFDERGLLPVVAQDVTRGAVLMLAWADREALRRTAESGFAWFWSRSRQRLWQKGETSGNVLSVAEVLADCDRDAVLYRVHPVGPTCHTGRRSCFGEGPAARLELGWLAGVIGERRAGGSTASYTARLLAAGTSRIAQKVGEEAVETVVAALDGSGRLADEAADLLYHLLVLLETSDVSLDQVADELRRRHLEAAPTIGAESASSGAQP